MSKDIFSGLDDLGFDDIDNLKLYANKKKQTTTTSVRENHTEKIEIYLYDKKVTCPVCENNFKVKAVKTSSYKMKEKDSDFFIRYEKINPYFYDVWVCNSCGYAAMKSDFLKIRKYQVDLIKENITPKWKGKEYKVPYDINTAIERYKLSLLNYYYMDSKASKKAMNCLKLAWMCRLTRDSKNEQDYLKQALKGFNDSYFNEDFPIYGMNKFTNMYLIGELNRRIGNKEEALLWFSKVITTPNINKRLKELARDQKDLIKESNLPKKIPVQQTTKKKGFFSSIFGK
ncbi:DUF2225 domain-containing protein [Clostridium aestuarii]|uniref:DUF2225 domain-containing protein n=1 Tax=Clostridium aestuarii TaxID=338193 RepID=A0ABT4CYJ9_9CLOT|nr:DUF2225 domain-containing protein [Clostridium aestuarii]